jgi:hypothetical protein
MQTLNLSEPELCVSCLSYGSCDFVVELYSEPGCYIIGDEKNDATLKSEVFFNTTDGSSGRRVMSDKPNESSAKSVQTEVTGSNKRALRASEVFFNTTDGHPSGLRQTSFPVPPASKKWKNKEWKNKEWANRFVYLYPTLVF